MKKIVISLFALALSLSLTAQNEQDVLRVSQFYSGGTARSIAMGGAVGAVGADFGALSVNPASSAIFRGGSFALTSSFGSTRTKASFLGNTLNDNSYSMGMDQIGFVLPLKSKNSSEYGIKSVNFSFGYNKLRDYNQSIVMDGVNNQNSLVDEFVYSANNSTEWDPFADGLAWETWLIDYDSLAGVFYSDFDISGYGQDQRRTIIKDGSLGEYVFNLSTNIADKIYIGGTMGIQRYRYNETWVHSESDPDDVIDFFNSFTYRNNLEIDGTGVNAKIGILAQPVNWLRVGGAVHTPTFFNMSDYFSSSMTTSLADGQDPHEYSATGDYDYDLITPLRANANVAFIYKNRAMFSVDYEYVDYSTGKLKASDYDFFNENQAVANRYGTASNLHFGGEVVFGPFFLRGGYALYGSPYVSGEANAGKNLSVISGGAGFRSNRVVFDLAVASASWDQEYFLYYNNSADLSSSALRFTGTLGFRF